ncbi:hypothetical protein GX888_00660 [Candidatus Dojkabacteria bacterium]|uniref:Fibronectin type-III domain-containing protein n=1 Tax=Candidatus Dojkabacteria bacterium TaxID=2099670 RepID=A0A847VCQ2_9BACT|nr:hypothetical protein [Candidatus Dojkabacteria bacterium]
MRIKTALITILLLCLIPVSSLFAQEQIVFREGVVVTAAIGTDLYSTITLEPITVEIYQPSTVTIRILSPAGVGIPGREVVIVAPGLVITQPTNLTDSTGRTSGSVYSPVTGTYLVCAKDTTFAYEITIENCRTLYVEPVAVPTLLPEPYYTKGTRNTLFWQSVGSGYEYYIEVSDKEDFSNIISNSGWVDSTSYQFTNLQNEKMYFYRVRAKNPWGGVSTWSNIVFSVQDSEPPVIKTLVIGDIGDNTTTQWESNYMVQMIFRVTDNLQLQRADFLCVNSSGSTYSCVKDYRMEGDNLVVNLRLKDLERISKAYLRDRYEFCVEASDAAGNIIRVCGIELIIPKPEKPPEKPTEKPPVDDEEKPVEIEPEPRPTVIEIIEKTLDDAIGHLELEEIERITTTASIITVTTAVALTIGSFFNFSYILIQLILNLLSWLGLRAGAKPLGYVYDSLTKEPIAQAIVRIFDLEGKIVWTDVTDAGGHFSARLEQGKYKILVRAPKYIFPSTIVFGKEDFPLTNVYHGEEFEVSDERELNFSIPLDPLEASKFRIWREIVWGRVKVILNILHIFLFVIGLVLAIYLYRKNPYWLTLVVLLLYIPSSFFIVRNIFGKRERYGVVKDAHGNPVSGLVVGLKEAEFDKVVAKRVTDSRGRYRMLVNRGRYYIEVLDTGYKVERIKGDSEVLIEKDDSWIVSDIVVSKLENS